MKMLTSGASIAHRPVLERLIEVFRLVVNLRAKIAEGDHLETLFALRRLREHFAERLVDDVAQSCAELGGSLLCPPEQLVVDDHGRSHIDEHTYVTTPTQRLDQPWAVRPGSS